MAKNSKHMKRYTMPRSWSIPKKTNTWAVNPSPGPHQKEASIPLMIALRDILKVGETSSEVRKVLSRRDVLVDRRSRMDHRFPVGLMDVLTLPKLKANYRVLLSPRGKIVLKSIGDQESTWKLARIMDKSIQKGGKVQLNLHDGRNILVDKDEFKAGDVIKISLPDQKVIARYPMQEESLAMLTGGAHVGSICRIKKINRTRNPMSNTVEFHEGFSTLIDYVFMVGTKTSEIEGMGVVEG